jgi:NADH-quinone oxidoreductase subunit G
VQTVTRRGGPVERGRELAAIESCAHQLREPERDRVRTSDPGDPCANWSSSDSLGFPSSMLPGDYSNSRGAVDMGLSGPGPDAGANARAPDWMRSGSSARTAREPTSNIQHPTSIPRGAGNVPDETALAADVVFPAASAYEKSGTVTNVCGEAQRLKKGLETMGTKPDLEIIGLIAKEMGLAPLMGPWLPDVVAKEMRVGQAISLPHHPIRSSHDTLFTSGTLGRYSKVLHAVMEGRGAR